MNNTYKSMIQTRDEIIEIIKKENFCLAAENKRLTIEILELKKEKAT